MYTPTPNSLDIVSRLRRINSHQTTHERAALYIEELERKLAAATEQPDHSELVKQLWEMASYVLLPMAKGYAAEHPVGNNAAMVQEAADTLKSAAAQETPDICLNQRVEKSPDGGHVLGNLASAATTPRHLARRGMQPDGSLPLADDDESTDINTYCLMCNYAALEKELQVLKLQLIAATEREDRLLGKCCLVCGLPTKDLCPLSHSTPCPCTFDPHPIDAAKRFLERAKTAEIKLANAKTDVRKLKAIAIALLEESKGNFSYRPKLEKVCSTCGMKYLENSCPRCSKIG